MPLQPFDSPRLKLRRARYHIGDLTEQIKAYLNRAPFFVQIAADPTFVNGKKWVVKVREEVPPDFSAIIGDVIHNLRTALDLLACELVRANNQSDADVYFPFADSENEIDKMIKWRHMDRAKPAVVNLIKGSAPWKAGNAPLRAIHDLDIMDKHQALIPTSDMIEMPKVPGFPVERATRMGPIRDGMGLAVLEPHAHLPVGFCAGGDFDLRFDPFHLTASGLKQGPLGGGEVVPTLINLAKLVENLIEQFIQVS